MQCFVLACLRDRPSLFHSSLGSYLVCVGTVDKISSFFSCVQGGPDSEPHLADFLTQSLRLLRAMAALLTARSVRCSGGVGIPSPWEEAGWERTRL